MLTPLFALGLVSPMRMTDGAIPIVIPFTGMLWGYFVHADARWRLGPFEWPARDAGTSIIYYTYGM